MQISFQDITCSKADLNIYILECTLFVKKNNDQFIKNKMYFSFAVRNDHGLEIIRHRTSIFDTSLHVCKHFWVVTIIPMI